MTDLGNRLREIIAVELQTGPEKITPTATLTDLGMDSVSALNILFAIEEAFGLPQIDPEEVAKIATVDDLETIVQRMLGAQPPSRAAGR